MFTQRKTKTYARRAHPSNEDPHPDFRKSLTGRRESAGGGLDLAAGAVRALYVVEGHANISAFCTLASLAANSAWYGAAMASLHAGAAGATLLRFELVAGADGGGSLLASPPLALDPDGEYLE